MHLTSLFYTKAILVSYVIEKVFANKEIKYFASKLMVCKQQKRYDVALLIQRLGNTG